MVVVPRIARHDAARDLTASKLTELTELARRFRRARGLMIKQYWDPSYAGAILRRDHHLVEAHRASGWPSDELSIHQNKVCLETTLGIIRGAWQAAIHRARNQVRRSAAWSEDREWALRALTDTAAIEGCLIRPRREATRCERRLRRLLLVCRGRRPRQTERLWFDLDCNLYRPYIRVTDRHFRGAWLAVTGLRPGRRINIPLAGTSTDDFASRTGSVDARPNVRVTVGKRVTFYVLRRMHIARPKGEHAAGIDKGLNTLATLSTGDPRKARTYGSNGSRVVDSIVEASSRRIGRQRLVAYERSLRNTRPARARRIRRRNLGRTKLACQLEHERRMLRELVNAALNDLFRTNPGLSRLYCEDLTFRTVPIARALNRRLGRWLKGYLQERLAYKAELNGVELLVVNAAYTSQTCPRCWFTSERNRRGERFSCAACGYTCSADGVAATNVLRRGSDSAITRFTPTAEVKRILEDRWRSARIGRAWGSNGVMPVSDESGMPVTAGAANRGSRGSTPAGSPYGGALSKATPGRPPAVTSDPAEVARDARRVAQPSTAERVGQEPTLR